VGTVSRTTLPFRTNLGPTRCSVVSPDTRSVNFSLGLHTLVEVFALKVARVIYRFQRPRRPIWRASGRQCRRVSARLAYRCGGRQTPAR
jgi:hypothetical protein